MKHTPPAHLTNQNPPAYRALMDFVVQGSLALALLVGLVYGIFQLGHLLGPLIPFSWEKQVQGIVLRDFPLVESGREAEARREVLQRLVDELTPHMDLPDGMDITVHYSNSRMVNAFATLGGHVVIFEGLIERLPSENALSMVVAHEIGHVKNRDAVRHMSGESLVQFIVSLATGNSELAKSVVDNIQLVTSRKFSRDAEERADREGLTALYGRYGHVNGYAQTFDALLDWIADNGGAAIEPPEFLRTHPDVGRRVERLAAYAELQDWPQSGELTPLRQANFVRPRSGWAVDPPAGADEPTTIKPDADAPYELNPLRNDLNRPENMPDEAGSVENSPH